ncbi:hypothetical protein Rs2_07865 [Raphanus sativus]|uniref:Uncharacterized protein LOC130502813 n=1 Tax=Raphanus sativus TaxID=3726 RepID=A0A9W3D634_RAPSA|nr:uncharacterized protein LOC130502813 [Raphanus sativus]XP_056859244.1 uncharacterized protein LOC130508065 [Raphanus sativus]KAJ4871301.1 hypothetical protein Rs2_47056 [Raphanus sativus]KAJ4913244.1 hypothetical protein Rs2_07865 [Raphanus sativus]
MILQLEVEEDIVRRAGLRESSYYGSFDDSDDDDDNLYQPVRMSCVKRDGCEECNVVVAKLMGLEMKPVTVKGKPVNDKLGTLLKRERQRRRDRTLDINSRNGQASCSSRGFDAMKPIRAVGSPSRVGGWPTLSLP